ncbi:MAG TPA: hypothetical protein VIK89_16570 [Cytophagaceae bacterium]
MSTLAKAISIAVKAHEGQKDKHGAPYILHVLSVMQKGRTEAEKICGALHDVVEDTDWTFEQLQKEGFSTQIIEALKCVTKKSEDEDYDAFIERTLTNPLAVRVKLNDLEDNMDIRRIPVITEKDTERLNKYLRAYRKIQQYLADQNL